VIACLRTFVCSKRRACKSTNPSLTGESVPASKRPDPLHADTVLADRVNMAYAGSLVTAGSGTGVVWATGDRTETGRVAFLIAEAVDLTTPLTRKIARFSGVLLWIILALAAALFAYGVLVRGGSVIEMLMASVALAVGVIPEGLPAAITIVLAIGVSRMAKRRPSSASCPLWRRSAAPRSSARTKPARSRRTK
jgi:cation-transporting P-type ATPase F